MRNYGSMTPLTARCNLFVEVIYSRMSIIYYQLPDDGCGTTYETTATILILSANQTRIIEVLANFDNYIVDICP